MGKKGLKKRKKLIALLSVAAAVLSLAGGGIGAAFAMAAQKKAPASSSSASPSREDLSEAALKEKQKEASLKMAKLRAQQEKLNNRPILLSSGTNGATYYSYGNEDFAGVSWEGGDVWAAPASISASQIGSTSFYRLSSTVSSGLPWIPFRNFPTFGIPTTSKGSLNIGQIQSWIESGNFTSSDVGLQNGPGMPSKDYQPPTKVDSVPLFGEVNPKTGALLETGLTAPFNYPKPFEAYVVTSCINNSSLPNGEGAAADLGVSSPSPSSCLAAFQKNAEAVAQVGSSSYNLLTYQGLSSLLSILDYAIPSNGETGYQGPGLEGPVQVTVGLDGTLMYFLASDLNYPPNEVAYFFEDVNCLILPNYSPLYVSNTTNSGESVRYLLQQFPAHFKAISQSGEPLKQVSISIASDFQGQTESNGPKEVAIIPAYWDPENPANPAVGEDYSGPSSLNLSSSSPYKYFGWEVDRGANFFTLDCNPQEPGNFTIPNLSTGTYTVTVQGEGSSYDSPSFNLTLNKNGSETLTPLNDPDGFVGASSDTVITGSSNPSTAVLNSKGEAEEDFQEGGVVDSQGKNHLFSYQLSTFLPYSSPLSLSFNPGEGYALDLSKASISGLPLSLLEGEGASLSGNSISLNSEALSYIEENGYMPATSSSPGGKAKLASGGVTDRTLSIEIPTYFASSFKAGDQMGWSISYSNSASGRQGQTLAGNFEQVLSAPEIWFKAISQNGKPLSQITVKYKKEGSGQSKTVMLDSSSGVFTIMGLASGTYTVTVQGEGSGYTDPSFNVVLGSNGSEIFSSQNDPDGFIDASEKTVVTDSANPYTEVLPTLATYPAQFAYQLSTYLPYSSPLTLSFAPGEGYSLYLSQATISGIPISTLEGQGASIDGDKVTLNSHALSFIEENGFAPATSSSPGGKVTVSSVGIENTAKLSSGGVLNRIVFIEVPAEITSSFKIGDRVGWSVVYSNSVQGKQGQTFTGSFGGENLKFRAITQTGQPLTKVSVESYSVNWSGAHSRTVTYTFSSLPGEPGTFVIPNVPPVMLFYVMVMGEGSSYYEMAGAPTICYTFTANNSDTSFSYNFGASDPESFGFINFSQQIVVTDSSNPSTAVLNSKGEVENLQGDSFTTLAGESHTFTYQLSTYLPYSSPSVSAPLTLSFNPQNGYAFELSNAEIAGISLSTLEGQGASLKGDAVTLNPHALSYIEENGYMPATSSAPVGKVRLTSSGITNRTLSIEIPCYLTSPFEDGNQVQWSLTYNPCSYDWGAVTLNGSFAEAKQLIPAPAPSPSPSPSSTVPVNANTLWFRAFAEDGQPLTQLTVKYTENLAKGGTGATGTITLHPLSPNVFAFPSSFTPYVNGGNTLTVGVPEGSYYTLPGHKYLNAFWLGNGSPNYFHPLDYVHRIITAVARNNKTVIVNAENPTSQILTSSGTVNTSTFPTATVGEDNPFTYQIQAVLFGGEGGAVFYGGDNETISIELGKGEKVVPNLADIRIAGIPISTLEREDIARVQIDANNNSMVFSIYNPAGLEGLGYAPATSSSPEGTVRLTDVPESTYHKYGYIPGSYTLSVTFEAYLLPVQGSAQAPTYMFSTYAAPTFHTPFGRWALSLPEVYTNGPSDDSLPSVLSSMMKNTNYHSEPEPYLNVKASSDPSSETGLWFVDEVTDQSLGPGEDEYTVQNPSGEYLTPVESDGAFEGWEWSSSPYDFTQKLQPGCNGPVLFSFGGLANGTYTIKSVKYPSSVSFTGSLSYSSPENLQGGGNFYGPWEIVDDWLINTTYVSSSNAYKSSPYVVLKGSYHCAVVVPTPAPSAPSRLPFTGGKGVLGLSLGACFLFLLGLGTWWGIRKKKGTHSSSSSSRHGL